MMPVRRMKIKAAPNIAKKINSLRNAKPVISTLEEKPTISITEIYKSNNNEDLTNKSIPNSTVKISDKSNITESNISLEQRDIITLEANSECKFKSNENSEITLYVNNDNTENKKKEIITNNDKEEGNEIIFMEKFTRCLKEDSSLDALDSGKFVTNLNKFNNILEINNISKVDNRLSEIKQSISDDSTTVPYKNEKSNSKTNKQNDTKLNIIKPNKEKLVYNTNNRKIKSETCKLTCKFESEEKRIFNERKQKYKEKLSKGNLEPSKMTMFDLIFWNPSDNPMPQQGKSNTNKSRRNSTSTETGSIISEVQEELRVEEEGLDEIKNDNSIIEADKENHHSSTEVKTTDENNTDVAPVVAPQVKIGPDGELIIDEKSLLIQTTAAKNRDKILNNTEVVEETNDSSHYGKWSKRRKRATEWTKKETARFYKALSTVGTDFSLMSTVFKWRSRSELKIKFKKEERINRHLIDTALNDCTQFDFSIFDESDYDPEEDRKESKEAEKAETKRRKDIERQRRQEERELERKRKQSENNVNKTRKRKLKEIFHKRKKKKGKKLSVEKEEMDDNTCDSTTPSLILEAQEVVCEVVFAQKEDEDVDTGGSVTIHDITNEQNAKESTSQSDDIESMYPLQLIEIKENECQLSSKSISECEDNITINYKNDVSISTGELQQNSLLSVNNILSEVESNVQQLALQNEGNTVESRTSTTNSNDESQLVSIPILTAESPQVCLPSSSVQITPDGFQYVQINTINGIKRVPVPPLPPSTSNIVVMTTQDPKNLNEQIFHVYLVSPLQVSTNVQQTSQTD